MGFSERSPQGSLRGMGVIGLATVASALQVGSKIGAALGIDSARFRSPEENFRLRQQAVDQALSKAFQKDQGAVLQLWLWTGIPNDGNHLPTRAARDYAVLALRRYYSQSGADSLPDSWMTALASPSPQPRQNAIPPVPGEFEGSGFDMPAGIDIGGMGGASGALALAAVAGVAFFMSRSKRR